MLNMILRSKTDAVIDRLGDELEKLKNQKINETLQLLYKKSPIFPYTVMVAEEIFSEAITEYHAPDCEACVHHNCARCSTVEIPVVYMAIGDALKIISQKLNGLSSIAAADLEKLVVKTVSQELCNRFNLRIISLKNSLKWSLEMLCEEGLFIDELDLCDTDLISPIADRASREQAGKLEKIILQNCQKLVDNDNCQDSKRQIILKDDKPAESGDGIEDPMFIIVD